jgi:hypothetical protein
MTSKLAAAVLAMLCVAACAQQPPATTAAAPPPAAPPPAPAAPPSDARVAPGKWEVARVRCSDLLRASDEDRASAAMFYYGYLAARAGIRVIDVSQISDDIHKVMQQCGTTPNMSITEAFRVTLNPTHKKRLVLATAPRADQ